MGAGQLLSSCSWLWLPKWGRGSNEARVPHFILSHFLFPQDGIEVLGRTKTSLVWAAQMARSCPLMCPYFSEMGD